MDDNEIRMKCLEIATRDWGIGDVGLATMTARALASYVLYGEVYDEKASEADKPKLGVDQVN